MRVSIQHLRSAARSRDIVTGACGAGSPETMREALRWLAGGRFASRAEVVEIVSDALAVGFFEVVFAPAGALAERDWRRLVARAIGDDAAIVGRAGHVRVMRAALLGFLRRLELFTTPEICEVARRALGETFEEVDRVLAAEDVEGYVRRYGTRKAEGAMRRAGHVEDGGGS